eukprot:3779898-Karenia_brevis.AAC.1
MLSTAEGDILDSKGSWLEAFSTMVSTISPWSSSSSSSSSLVMFSGTGPKNSSRKAFKMILASLSLTLLLPGSSFGSLAFANKIYSLGFDLV